MFCPLYRQKRTEAANESKLDEQFETETTERGRNKKVEHEHDGRIQGKLPVIRNKLHQQE